MRIDDATTMQLGSDDEWTRYTMPRNLSSFWPFLANDMILK